MRLFPVIIGIALISGCGAAADRDAGNGLPHAAATHAGRIQIVAAESLWGDIAGQIGGNRVDVTSILDDPGQDPHEYESGVGDAATIARADVVIVNGADYDPFMDRLLSVDDSPGRTVLTVSTIVKAPAGANPHLWVDPAYVKQTANAVERALAARDPRHARRFAARLAGFTRGENRVVAVIGTIRRTHAGDPVGYTEPVPAYLVAAAGLTLGTPGAFSTAMENGVDPSPGDAAHFEQAITHRTIKALLLNTQVGDAETARLAGLAHDHGVPVVDVEETLPRGEDFQTWQLREATDLLQALDG